MKIGFPTGKLSESLTLHQAIERNHIISTDWCELTVLRHHEMEDFFRQLKDIKNDAAQLFLRKRSLHAPVSYKAELESEIVQSIVMNIPSTWNVVVHPDSIHNPVYWERLGDRCLLENMDMRKKLGQRVHHLQEMFKMLPKAGFCFDIGHARQVDASMEEAIQFHETFFDKLREIHMAVVDRMGVHQHLDRSAVLDFRKVLRARDHRDTPVVLEVPLDDVDAMREDLKQAHEAFAHSIA